MFKWLILGLLLVLISLAACTPAPNLLDDTLLHDTSLITKEPCGPPCFRGITPGETGWNDAVTILEDDHDFKNVQIQNAQDASSKQVLAAWQEGDNGVCCQIRSEDGETVSLVFLRTAPDMKLSDVIDAYGDPTYLTVQEFTDDQAVGSLVYPQQLMVVYVFVAGAATGEFTPESQIIGALYMVQSDMDLLQVTENLHTWKGYQSYSAYAESDFEVTPSITLTPTPGS